MWRFTDVTSHGSYVLLATLCVLFVLATSASPQIHSANAQQPVNVTVAGIDEARLTTMLDAVENGLPYVPGEILVRFKPGAEPWARASALKVLRADVDPANSDWIGDVLHLKKLDIEDPVRAAENLRRQPEVLYAQPNYLRRPHSVPNDTNYSQQWQFETINLPRAWDINPGGRSDVVVAVVDTGLTTTTGTYPFPLWTGQVFQTFAVPFAQAMDFDHSRVRTGTEVALDGGWILPSGENLLFDAVGHGTHVAGTIAQQTNNTLGYAGVAYAVTLLPVKVCWSYWDIVMRLGVMRIPRTIDPNVGNCSDDAVARGLRYAADNGARVINVSLGGTGASPIIEEALRYAVERGAFVTISAGNHGDTGNPVIYPAAYARDINGVVAVGAVSKDLSRARYSSFGSYVELVAPGGDGGPRANEIWQIAPLLGDLSAERLAPRFDRYQPLESHGTSMASPHVAGLAALLLSQGVTRPAAIEAALRQFARDLGPAGRDDEYGHGLIDARATLRGMGAAR